MLPRLHTMFDAISTIVRSEAERFRPGDPVIHKRFGMGEIRDVHGRKAIVRFLKKGEKKLLTDFLEPADRQGERNH